MAAQPDQKNTVNVTIKCQHDGFGFDLDAELFVEMIPGLVKKLRDAGVTPANSPYVWEGQPQDRGNGHGPEGAPGESAPQCPVHGKPMKKSQYSGYYCPRKTDDGAYCDQKVT